MRILIIDDEAAVADVLADALSSEGHTATVAHRGDEALSLLDQVRPDAVFLDVRMPDMSGIEVLRSIRRSDSTLPVILLTGRADPDEISEARALGVVDIIDKPFALTHLGDALGGLHPGSRDLAPEASEA